MDLKYEHYRLEAAHCEAEAESATTAELKADWLRLAAQWLSMIPYPARAEETFAVTVESRATATPRERSNSSH